MTAREAWFWVAVVATLLLLGYFTMPDVPGLA